MRSTVRPASFCDIVGHKPSLGLLPRSGLLRQAAILNQPGLMVRSVDEVGLLAQTLGGHDETAKQSYNAGSVAEGDQHALRIAVVRGPLWSRADQATREALGASSIIPPFRSKTSSWHQASRQRPQF